MPIALTAVNTETLQAAGITSTAELGQVVPRLRLDLSGAFFQPTGNAKVSYGRYNEVHASAAASTGLSDAIAVGLSGVYARSDGFARDVNTGRKTGGIERYGVRGKILLEPSEAVSFLLTGEYYHAHDDNILAYNAFDGRTFARAVPGIAVPTRRGRTASDINQKYEVERKAVSLRATFEMDGGTATAISGYSTEMCRAS